MLKQEISTKKAPTAIGPYSQAVSVGGMIFCSGQVAIDPKTNTMVEGGIKEQTKQVLENLKAVLEGAGAGLGEVVKTTVYLKDIGDFAEMNDVYGKFFKKPFPARATIQVARLPKDALVEIECIAFAKELLTPTSGCCGGESGCECC